MHPSYVPIEEATLRRLYVDERLTTVEVAARLRCGASTIGRRLRQFGLAARPRGPRVERRWGGDSHPAWSPEVAYAVGLIATDGNLSGDGRHLSIPSTDLCLLESLRSCLGLTNSITERSNGNGYAKGHIYRLQWGDRHFYDWLVSIGLTPAKTLTLGPIAIPDEYFADFFRGCIDGDGTILVYTDRYHVPKNERYVYERLYVSLVSASSRFIEWIHATMRRLLGVGGAVHVRRRVGRHPIYVIRYAKKESFRIARAMYYSADVPCLMRKRVKAERFAFQSSPRYSCERGRGGVG